MHNSLPDPLFYGEEAEGGFERQRKRVGLFLGPALAILLFFLPIEFPNGEAHRLFSIFVCVVAWWVTEPIPLPVTALFGASLAVIFQIADIKKIFSPFSDPIIFLFMGSFFLARAMQVHGLDEKIAVALLSAKRLKNSPLLLFAFLGGLCAFLSMWLSNSAVTAIFYPIALGILRSLKVQDEKKMTPALLLLVAYSASLGGMGTPVGTPPNLIGIAMLDHFANIRISFFEWMVIAIPIFLVGLAGFLIILKFLYPIKIRSSQGETKPEEKTPFTKSQKLCLLIFAVTITLWIVPGVISITASENSFLKSAAKSIPEAVAAMAGAVLLFIVPSDGKERRGLLTWKEAVGIDWGTLILFGGGLSLGSLMFETKLAQFVGEKWLVMFGKPSLWAFTLLSIVVGVVLTEFASNTAAANIIIPVIISVAQTSGISPLPPVLGATIACSMAFMLPVSTPPNAIVYGSGLVSIKDMIKTGVLLDILMMFVVFFALRVLLLAYGIL